MFDNAINFVEGTDMTEPYCGGSFVYANYDRCVEVGDLVVVENSGIGGKHLRVVKVAALIEKSNAVDDRQPVPVYGEVVAVVDASAYEDRVNNRAKLIETRKKMEERAKRLQDVAIYKMLASEDPEMEGLWKEFVALGGAK